jgi:hypothetical protein
MGRAASILVVLLGILMPAGGGVRAQHRPELHELKAAFVYHFIGLVEWPPDAIAGAFRVCVAGEDVFQGALARMIRGEMLHGRPASFQAVPYPERSCHVLYVPDRSSAHVYIRETRDYPVLTIGETADAFDQGTIIRLFLDGTHLRFAVNLDAARRSGLRVSSRLVELARSSGAREE